MRALLRLYPKAWRDRYGEEFEALLEDHAPGVLGSIDIVRGALDVQLHISRHGANVIWPTPVRRADLREELRAVLAAREELGPEHEEHLVDAFLDRLDQTQRDAVRSRSSRGRQLRRGLGALLVAGATLAAGTSIALQQHGPGESQPPVVMSCAPMNRCKQVYITPLDYRLSAQKISRQGYRLIKRWSDASGFTHAIWVRTTGEIPAIPAPRGPAGAGRVGSITFSRVQGGYYGNGRRS